MAAAFGWRSTFVFAGLLGVVWLFFWIPMFREAPVVEGEEEALYWASKDLALFSASVDEQPVGVEPFYFVN
jgi:predicted MFS family arabinose efflux permease